MLRKISLWALLALLLMAPLASAATISLLAGVNQSKPAVSTSLGSVDVGAETGIGGGAALGFAMSGGWGLELDLLYVPRVYSLTTSSTTYKWYQTTVEVPIIVRYWLLSWFSVGAGGYYAKYLGSLKQDITTGGTTTKASGSYSDASQTTSDYGGTVSAALDIPLGVVTGLVIDGRYTLGLKNNSTASGSSIKFKDMTGFVGLRFGR